MYFYTCMRKAAGSSPAPKRPQQTRSNRAPSKPMAPKHTGEEAPHVGTSLHPSADKQRAGDESATTATPLRGPSEGTAGVCGARAQRSRGKGASCRVFAASTVSLPLAESENAIIPAKRSTSCNSILKTRSLRIVQATVLSDLEAGKRRAK